MIPCFIYYKYPLYPGGSYFQEFLNKFAGSVQKIYLIASYYPKGDLEKPANLKCVWVPLLKLKYLDELFFIIACFLKAIFTRELKNIDIINVIGPRGLFAGWYLKNRYKVPLVCTIEMLNEGKDLFNRIYYRIVKYLLMKVPIDKYICWSNYYWKNHLKRWRIPESKVEIIPCGIDTDKYNPNIDGSAIKNKYASNDPLIVFAKPLYHENTEAVKILVKAIAVLKSKRKVKLLIGGGEGQGEIEMLAKELNVSELVDFMPQTKFTDIPKYIAAADIVVLPFVYAPTTSRSLLEAMAMGKAIITVSIGEINEILENNKSAILVNRDPSEISEAINRLVNDKQLRSFLGTNALEIVKTRFSMKSIIDKVNTMLLEVGNTERWQF